MREHSGLRTDIAIVRQHVARIDGVARTWLEWDWEGDGLVKTLVVEVGFDTDPNSPGFRPETKICAKWHQFQDRNSAIESAIGQSGYACASRAISLSSGHGSPLILLEHMTTEPFISPPDRMAAAIW